MLVFLAQLLGDACAAGRTLALPNFTSGREFVVLRSGRTPLPFGDVFDVDYFRNGVHPCRVAEHIPPDATVVDGIIRPQGIEWQGNYSDSLAMVYRSLRLNAKLGAILRNLSSEAVRVAGPRWSAIHLRIERDWWIYSTMCRRPGVRRCYRPEEVADITRPSRQHLGGTGALLIYADHLMASCGPAVRSDDFGEQTRKLPHDPDVPYTARTAIEFFLAASAPGGFYGNSFSSFSQGVARMRSSRCEKRAGGAAIAHPRYRCTPPLSFAYDCGPDHVSASDVKSISTMFKHDKNARGLFQVVNNGSTCYRVVKKSKTKC